MEFTFQAVQPEPLFVDFPVETWTDINRLLHIADHTLDRGRRSAIVIGQAIGLILCKRPTLTACDLEIRYRSFSSQTFLLAAPKQNLPAHVEPRLMSTGQPAEFHLWICVNGANEAATTRRQFGIRDAEENRTRLIRTGMLSPVKQARPA